MGRNKRMCRYLGRTGYWLCLVYWLWLDYSHSSQWRQTPGTGTGNFHVSCLRNALIIELRHGVLLKTCPRWGTRSSRWIRAAGHTSWTTCSLVAIGGIKRFNILSGRRDLLSCLLTLSHERAGRGEQIDPLGELIKPIRELITWCLIPGIADKTLLTKQLMLQGKRNVRDRKTKAGGYGRPKGLSLRCLPTKVAENLMILNLTKYSAT